MITLKSILVPTDFSETANLALDYAKALAENFQASLHVLYVMSNPMLGFQPPDHVCPIPLVRKEMEAQAKDYMSKVLTDAEREKYHAELVSQWGIPAEDVIRYAQSHKIDLIVMGTYGRGFLGHLILGSVAEKVIRKASCPVLVVRKTEHGFITTEAHAEAKSEN
jgi:nucleotide-binding universal stress UspA family protein